jgi:hypothetical protein
MDEAPTSEPDDAGTDHQVPDDLLELHQVIEWEAAEGWA